MLKSSVTTILLYHVSRERFIEVSIDEKYSKFALGGL